MEQTLQYTLDLSRDSQWHILSPTGSAKANLLYLQEMGSFQAGPEYFTIREGFPSYLIKLTLSGCGQLRYGGRTYATPPGSFFWIDCMEHQEYRTDPKAGQWKVVWVHFYGANAKFYYENFLQQTGGKPVGSFAPGSPIYSVFRTLLALDYSGRAQLQLDFQAASLLTQVMGLCVDTVMTPQQQNQIPQVVQDAHLYLTQNYTQGITLTELGERFGISPFHLQKLFKRFVGLSPAECLIHLRIARGKELIRTTRLSLGEIAERIGMSSQNYFTLQFKSLEGMTPSEYRRRWPTMEQQISK